MHRCEDCKIILDNDVKHCPKCGKGIAVKSAAEAPEPIMDVPRLVAAANLHKFRSEWDEALAAATDALRMEPRNPEITLTLGSIYEEHEMLEEALVWYQMTLELDSGNPQAKAARDRIGMLQSARRKQAAALPKADPRKRARLYAYGIGAAVLLMAIIVVFSLAGRGRGPSASNTTGRSKGRSLAPPISQPWAKKTNRPAPTVPEAAAPSLSGDTASIPLSGGGGALRTKAEQTIRSGLASAQTVTETGASIDDVIADPRASVVAVTFSVPLKGVVTRDQITRAAAAVARKAFELHPAVQYVTTRCIIQVPNSEGSQIAFVADIQRKAITPTATEQQVAAAFSHPWWNPQIK